MISLAIVLASCFLIGLASTNRIAQSHRLHSSFGLVIFLIATNSFSALLNWNVGKSASLVIFIAIVVIASRAKRLSHVSGFWREILAEFMWVVIVAIALSPVFLTLSKDIASRNFDAYYATQDGIFLSDNSVLESTGKVTELLPLIWGADSSDRYGISFFTSLIIFVTNQNPWLAAKYIYLAIASISIFAFRALILSFLTNTQKNLANFLSVIYIISPFFILQSMYFMYGQTIALVFFPLFILLLRDYKSRLNLFWLGIIVVTSFISYPAISLILGLVLLLLLTVNLFEKEDREKHLRNFLLIVITILSAVTLAFGFNISIILNRVWTWIGGHLGLTKTLENTSETIRIELFSQFDSILGVPLFLGLIPHPFVQNWNMLAGVVILLVVVWYLIHSTAYMYQHMIPISFRRVFLVVVCVSLFVPFVSFIKGSGYIVFKTSTWFGPYFLITFILVTLHKFRSLPSSQSDLFSNSSARVFTYCITSLVLLGMVFNTSFQYSKMFSSWNSFNQIPNEVDSAQLSLIRDIGEGGVAIFTPTAEESTWLSGMLMPSLTTRTLSIGQNEQALTEGLKTSCELNKVQRNFSQVTSVLYSNKTLDVTPPVQFNGQSRAFEDWELRDVKDLKFAMVVNSGAFPPTLATNHPLPIRNQVAMRWSGGALCLGIYSSTAKVQKVRVPIYVLNSEVISQSRWNIILNKKLTEMQAQVDYLDLKLSLQKGWNSLLLRNEDCPSRIDVNRLRGNSDDRPLCVMFGGLTLTK